MRGGQIGGLKFRRQYVISPYIVDFICLERRLIVEVDGAQHADRAGHDARRDRYLRSEGFSVLRFSDREALTQIASVRERIWQAARLPPP